MNVSRGVCLHLTSSHWARLVNIYNVRMREPPVLQVLCLSTQHVAHRARVFTLTAVLSGSTTEPRFGQIVAIKEHALLDNVVLTS